MTTIEEKMQQGEIPFTRENFIASRVELIEIGKTMLAQLDNFSASVRAGESPKNRHLRVVDRSAICCHLNQFNREITLARSGMIFTLGEQFIEGFDAEKKYIPTERIEEEARRAYKSR